MLRLASARSADRAHAVTLTLTPTMHGDGAPRLARAGPRRARPRTRTRASGSGCQSAARPGSGSAAPRAPPAARPTRRPHSRAARSPRSRAAAARSRPGPPAARQPPRPARGSAAGPMCRVGSRVCFCRRPACNKVCEGAARAVQPAQPRASSAGLECHASSFGRACAAAIRASGPAGAQVTRSARGRRAAGSTAASRRALGGTGQRAARARAQQAHLLLGSDVAHVAGGGLVRLDDAEAGVAQALADRARKVAAAGQHHEAAREELRRDLGRQPGRLKDLGRQPPALGVLVKHAREAAAHLRARPASSPGRAAASAPGAAAGVSPRRERARPHATPRTASRRRQGFPAHAHPLLPLQEEHIRTTACYRAPVPAAVPGQDKRGPHQEPARHAHGVLRDPLYRRRGRGRRGGPAADADRLAVRARGLRCRSGQRMAAAGCACQSLQDNAIALHGLCSLTDKLHVVV